MASIKAWVERHPWWTLVGVFAVWDFPQWFQAVWSLADPDPPIPVIWKWLEHLNVPVPAMPTISGFWISVPAGLAMFAYLSWAIGLPAPTRKRERTFKEMAERVYPNQKTNPLSVDDSWWGILFAGNEGQPLYLKFLPDTGDKDRMPDALLLLLYGYKKFRGKNEVPLTEASDSVFKSRGVIPPNLPEFMRALHLVSVYSNPLSAEHLSEPLIAARYVEKIGLSRTRGGFLKITLAGESAAARLATDLISRA